MDNNNRNTFNIVYSVKQGNFQDVYFSDKKGRTFRASFYCSAPKPFAVVPVDISKTIPTYGNF